MTNRFLRKNRIFFSNGFIEYLTMLVFSKGHFCVSEGNFLRILSKSLDIHKIIVYIIYRV